MVSVKNRVRSEFQCYDRGLTVLPAVDLRGESSWPAHLRSYLIGSRLGEKGPDPLCLELYLSSIPWLTWSNTSLFKGIFWNILLSLLSALHSITAMSCFHVFPVLKLFSYMYSFCLEWVFSYHFPRSIPSNSHLTAFPQEDILVSWIKTDALTSLWDSIPNRPPSEFLILLKLCPFGLLNMWPMKE